MFKVNNRNTRERCEICPKLTITTPERRHWRRSGIFIVNFERISYLFIVFLFEFEQVNVSWVLTFFALLPLGSISPKASFVHFLKSHYFLNLISSLLQEPIHGTQKIDDFLRVGVHIRIATRNVMSTFLVGGWLLRKPKWRFAVAKCQIAIEPCLCPHHIFHSPKLATTISSNPY